MHEGSRNPRVLSAVEFGFFLLLVGVIFMITPKLPGEIAGFFQDFAVEEVYPGLFLPVPKSNHPVLYSAAFRFSLSFAIFQIVILAAEFLLGEPVDKKSGTFSGVIFWFGLAASLNMLKVGRIGWFVFLGFFIVLAGTAMVVRNVISLFSKLLSQRR